MFDVQSGKLVHRLEVAHRLGQGLGVPAGRPGVGHRRGRSADSLWDVATPGPAAQSARATAGRSTRWPTVPTGGCWRRPDSTTRCGSSTPSRDGCSANWPRRAATSAPSASRPTARGWPRRAAPDWSASGTADAGRQVADVQVSTRRICALAYSPDGKFLAAAGQQRDRAAVGCRLGQARGRSAGAAGRSAGALLLRTPNCWPRPAAAT